jgi:photosystem II stability/assembly factor-like uncharacterized protein
MKKICHHKIQSHFIPALLVLGALLMASLVNSVRVPIPRGFNFSKAAAAQASGWSPQTSGVAATLWSVHFINDNVGWAAGENATLLQTTNGGANWSPVNHCGSPLYSVRFLDQSVGWAGGPGAVARTGNGGTSFNCGSLDVNAFHSNFFPTSPTLAWSVGFYVQSSPPFNICRLVSRITFNNPSFTEEIFTACPGASLFDVYFVDANNGWAVGESGTIVRITNTAATPPTITAQTSGTTQLLWGIHMLDLNTGWAVGDGGTILKTTNGGSSWSSQSSGTALGLRDVHFVNANSGRAVGVGGLILATTNGGATWATENSNVTDDLGSVFFPSLNAGYAVGVNGRILKWSSGCPNITVNPANPTLPSGTAGQPYSQSFTASGGTAPHSFTVSAGTLPPGLSLSSGGLLSGTPTGFGAFNFTVQATDASGCTGTRAYTLLINPPCPTITVNPATLPVGTVGTPYNQTLTATGGTTPYSFAVTSGALPPGLTLSSTGVLSGTPTTAGPFTFTVTATDANNCTGSRGYSVTISSGTQAGLQYYPLPSPVRLLDTRPGASACFAPGAPLGNNAVRLQTATGACSGIPATAKAIVGNATVVNSPTISTGSNWITLYPSDAAQPNASNLNFSDNQVIPNQFTVGLGPDGAFKIYSSASTHFIVDVTGYYAPPGGGGLYYHPLPAPVRLFDSRPGETACDAPGMPLGNGGTRTVLAHGTCLGATIPSSAKVIVGNATVVNFISSGSNWITLYPFGATQPNASNLNFTANQIISNAIVVGLSSDGKFNIYSSASTHFIVDVNGYFSDQAVDVNGQGLLYYALPAPVRLLDTRPGESGCDAPGAPLGTMATRTQLAHRTCFGVTVPSTANAVVGNATVVNFISSGYNWITLYPFGATQPNASNINFTANQIIPNAFVAGLSTDGKFNIYSHAATHFIVDLNGYFAP